MSRNATDRKLGSRCIKVCRWSRGINQKSSSVVPIQFGRIHGIALAILGIVLLGIQTMYYMMPTNVIIGPTRVWQRAIMRSTHYLEYSACYRCFVGVAIIATANRRDEPDRKNAVK